MSEKFDAIVIGMGPGGEVAASQLLRAGKRVAVVERELIGGECGYWACVPSKTLLRPPEAKGGVDRAAGVGDAQLDWPTTRDYRDYMIRHLDDTNQVKGYEKAGATVLKGVARIAGPGRVDVDGQAYSAEHIVVATGSDAFIPPIPGLDEVTMWTNREATTLTEIPRRAVMIGGSAAGVELGLFLRRYGAYVTILERSARLLSRRSRAPVSSPSSTCARRASTSEPPPVRYARARTARTPSWSSTAAQKCAATSSSSAPGAHHAPLTSAWNRSASNWANVARSWSMSTAGPPTASGRSVTSPA
jgi:cation diffusion facilitator CzcD-associated flavoprotein CzcO